jgi:SH3 domain-containing protein
MKKPKAKSGGRWLAAAGILYAGVTGGGIGTATYLDATRPAPVVREIVPPREALIAREDGRKRPDAPEPLLPPCTADAVRKPEDPASEQGTVTAMELNVRQTPAGRIVGQVYRGDKVDILERRANGGGVEWLRTPRGWVAARFVDVVIAEPAPAEDVKGVEERPSSRAMAAPACFPPGPWCPTPSLPFLPPLTQR